MTTHAQFIDDVRTVVFFDTEDGAPTRAVLELPSGTVECGLVPLDGSDWAKPGFTVWHQVVHTREHRPPLAETSSVPSTYGWLTPTAIVLASFVAAGCVGAVITSAAMVLSHL